LTEDTSYETIETLQKRNDGDWAWIKTIKTRIRKHINHTRYIPCYSGYRGRKVMIQVQS
jgi:hypothetical protein